MYKQLTTTIIWVKKKKRFLLPINKNVKEFFVVILIVEKCNKNKEEGTANTTTETIPFKIDQSFFF